jgi:hypothetical protein
MGWTTGVQFPVGQDFCLRHNVQTGSEAHPASCPVGTVVIYSEVKWLGSVADHSPPSCAEAKNAWSYTPTPSYVYMEWCLLCTMDNFTLIWDSF